MRHYFKRRKDKKLFRRALCGFRPDKRPGPEDCIKPIDYYSLKNSGVWEVCSKCRELVDPMLLVYHDTMRKSIKDKIENIEKAYEKGTQELIDKEEKQLFKILDSITYNKWDK